MPNSVDKISDILLAITVPCLLPDVEKQSEKAALSLGLCGNIAIEKYNLLSTT